MAYSDGVIFALDHNQHESDLCSWNGSVIDRLIFALTQRKYISLYMNAQNIKLFDLDWKYTK